MAGDGNRPTTKATTGFGSAAGCAALWTDLHHLAVLVVALRPVQLLLPGTSLRSNCQPRQRLGAIGSADQRPPSLLSVGHSVPRSWSFAITAAPKMALPDGSVTLPAVSRDGRYQFEGSFADGPVVRRNSIQRRGHGRVTSRNV
jgi:hypothetical protein